MISLRCGQCGKDLKVTEELAGKKVKCPGCQKPVVVPQLVASPSPALSRTEERPTKARLGAEAPKERSQAEHESLSDADGKTGLGAGIEERTQVFRPDGGSAELTDFLAPPQADDELGRLGGFRILKILGHGGMGVVFQAEDPKLGRKVAIKAMLPHLAGSRSSHERFMREAKAAAALEHDHIVAVHHVGEDRGAPFIVMPFLQGEPLDERLKRENVLHMTEVLRIGRETAEGLAAAHERGMMHRDIKPANLWLEGDKARVKILDFGLARAGGESGLTQTGAIIGTPQYMAPEQAAGNKDIDHRCDLFSLGCVLYRMCTGELPFRGKDAISTLIAVASHVAPPPVSINAELPAKLSDLVMQLLAKDPQQRPASAREVAEALRNMEQDTFGGDPKTPRQFRTMNSSTTQFLARPQTQAKSPKSPVRVVGAVAILAAALMVAGVILVWQTPHGLVKIETDDPNVEIVFDKTGPTIKGAGKEPISLRAGEHGIQVKRGDFEFGTDKLVIKKGETTTLKIHLLGGKMQLMQDGKEIAAKDMPLATTFTNSLGMEFVLVPKGKAWLGGGGGKPGEKEVEIMEDFYLGKYEVTQGEWHKVMGVNPSAFKIVAGISKEDQTRFPVEQVSWDDAQLFLIRFNEQVKDTGWVYRLPKELEWEYACRGGAGDKVDGAFDFYFDQPTNQLLPQEANFAKGLKRTCKVGSYKPNKLGLYDMHGNVGEWCQDEEKVDKGVSHRVRRGGGWQGGSVTCRAALRNTIAPSSGDDTLGLRLARVPVGKEIVAETASGPVHLPSWVERKWIEEVSQLPAEQQVGVVRTKLQERNPGYDGKADFKMDGGRVVEFQVWTDKVFELSPLRAFTGLRKLDCRGSGAGKSILQDLSPLQGLPLTVLNLHGCTQVYDLSPLRGLKLAELDCASTLVTNLKPLVGQPLRVLNSPYRSWLGAEPLRSIKTLETINGQTEAAFWKQVNGQAAEFEKFRKFVALLPAADQVKEVTARLKKQNPGFTAMPTSTIDQDTGTVKEIAFPTEHLIDLSPVRAFPRLQSLNLLSDAEKSKLVDLTPLQGMKLTSLNLYGCAQVRDLTPLQGMPLTSLSLGHSQVLRDLTPLQGMKLTSLIVQYCPQVRDLTPLRGMPLTSLVLNGYTELPDFALLQGMKLTYLNLANCGQVRDLTPLGGMKLTYLDLANSGQVRDLTPLQGMKLTYLGLNGCTQVRDLTPLKGMKLQALYAETTGVQDLTPLADMPLEDLDFTPKNITRGIEVIQRMTTLKRIGNLQPAEFWKKYKAGEFNK